MLDIALDVRGFAIFTVAKWSASYSRDRRLLRIPTKLRPYMIPHFSHDVNIFYRNIFLHFKEALSSMYVFCRLLFFIRNSTKSKVPDNTGYIFLFQQKTHKINKIFYCFFKLFFANRFFSLFAWGFLFFTYFFAKM